MAEKKRNEEFVIGAILESQTNTQDLLEQLFDAANPEAVFSAPIVSGDYTIINASDLSVGLGVGYGLGASSGAAEDEDADESGKDGASLDAGTGGGGGGGTVNRPIAVISIGPDGVDVEPIVDVTKIILAFFTVVGSMALMFSKMRKLSRGE